MFAIADTINACIDKGTGMLNEFVLMYTVRSKFPLHYTVFKQVSGHLPHEANTEQLFSLAGRLSDPNKDPIHLARQTRHPCSKKQGRLYAFRQGYLDTLQDQVQQERKTRWRGNIGHVIDMFWELYMFWLNCHVLNMKYLQYPVYYP